MLLSDKEIIEGIRHRDNVILRFIYRAYYPSIKFFIMSNSGREEDAEDIFQEAVIVLYNKYAIENPELNCSFRTYFFAVCKKLWLKQLSQQRQANTISISDEEDKLAGPDVLEIFEQNQRYRLFQEHFFRISADCQKVLSLFLKKTPLRQIAEIMGYASEKYAKKRKYKCKEALIRSIMQDPRYSELTNNPNPKIEDD